MPGIIFRTPCTFHSFCDETSVAILHNRSAKDGPITEKEWAKACWVCEGITKKELGDTLRSKGVWKCPVCGFTHTVDIVNRGPVVPTLSIWYKAIDIKEDKK